MDVIEEAEYFESLIDDDLLSELTVKGFVRVLRKNKMTHSVKNGVLEKQWDWCDACGSVITRGFEVYEIKYYDHQFKKWNDICFCSGCEDTSL